jgi:hypothetical protein
MKTCQITFREAKNNRYIKGNSYSILPMIGEGRIKLFRVYHENGTSFCTDENHINKFFK